MLVSLNNVANLFRSFKSTKEMLRNLRYGICELMGYEDVGILVKDIANPLYKESSIYFSLSPNVPSKDLLSAPNMELFYYNPPSNSLTMNMLDGRISSPTVYQNPRDRQPYYEGIDNLSPVVYCLTADSKP